MITSEFRFDGYQAMIDFADSSARMSDRRSRDLGRASWSGTGTWAEAVELARHGWADGAAAIKREADKMADLVRPKGRQLEAAYSVVGPGVLDMGRYVQGHPEPWIAWQESERVAETPGRGVLRIAVNIGASGQESTVSMFTRGATVAALVDALEIDGYRCEVSICSYNTDKAQNRAAILMTATVKAADQPLEMETLAFALAHPASQRRINFGVREHAPSDVRTAMGITRTGVYGYSRDLPYSVRGEFDIYVGTRLGLHTDMTEWVCEQLDAQGVEVEGWRERKAAEEARYAALREQWKRERAANPTPEPAPLTAAQRAAQDREWRRYQREAERGRADVL